MLKFVTASIAALVVGWVLAGSATHAKAGCSSCGPIPPSTYYKTIHPSKTYTRYRDVSVYRHVNRIHRIINVTRVQPIIHINDITRVHHHTVVHTRNAYEHETQYITPIRIVHHSVQNTYDCGCAP